MMSAYASKSDAYQRMACVLLVLTVIGLACVIVIMASVPPVDRDALTHHLVIPKLYLQKGKMYEIPSITFSYYPMNIDLLYLLPLYFNNDIVAKYIHFAFACITAGLIFSYLKNRLDRRHALIGALFFLSLPVIVKLSISAYVDLGLIFFSTASMLALVAWMRKGMRARHLVVAAIWCGLALGTKYNGLVVFFILSCAVPVLFIRGRRSCVAAPTTSAIATTYRPSFSCNVNDVSRKALVQWALFVLVSLAVFSPWMIRNFVWTGNPVYPLYDHYFKPERLSESLAEGLAASSEEMGLEGQNEPGAPMTHFAVRRIVFKESLAEILMIPLRIFFQGEDDHPQYFDGRLSPFLLLLPLLSFIPKKPSNGQVELEKRFFAGFSLLFVVLTLFLTDMRIRYVSAVIPPLVILSMFGVDRLKCFVADWACHRRAWVPETVCLVAVILALGMNGRYIADLFHKVDPSAYLSGRLDRDAYIEERRPEYAAIQHANRFLDPTSKVMFLFLGHRLYYSNLEAVEGEDRFLQVVVAGKTPTRMFELFQRLGVTHLLINSEIFASWADAQFDTPQRSTVHGFFHSFTIPLFSKNGYELLELRFHDGNLS